MAPINPAEEDAIAASILQELSDTSYACSSLTQLRGGTANFVYRGFLAQPLPGDDGFTVKSVIIKHSTDFVAINRDFPLDVTRCTFEGYMLNPLAAFLPPPTADAVIKTPRLYHFNRQTNTQVIQDFPGTEDLKSIFFLPDAADFLPGPSPVTIGHRLGFWLKAFHVWAREQHQGKQHKAIGVNNPMRDLKRMITYDSVLGVIENYPELLAGHKEALETIRDAMGKEFEKLPGEEDGEDWGVIHGDFRSGNVLLQKEPWKATVEGTNKLFIIDWEFSQYGHRAYDLGQMIGDLYERKVFNDIDIVIPVMQGFIDGYGELSDDMAYRIAIHAGVQLITWYIRRPRTGPLTVPLEDIVAGLRVGRDIILKGWEKDRFFEGSMLASLFTK